MAANVAVLVDGENISGKFAQEILDLASRQGTPSIVRVYQDAQTQSEWHKAAGYRMIHAGTGKNAADLLLVIDAMEFALSKGIDQFLIASSDRDFTHLAQRLREHGLFVMGVGEAKAPKTFRAACTSFIEIGRAPEVKDSAGAVPVSDTSSAVADLDLKIQKAIAVHSKNGAGMQIAALGAIMHTQHSIRISTYPERNWRAYLMKRPELYDLDPRGPEAHVRFKRSGFLATA